MLQKIIKNYRPIICRVSSNFSNTCLSFHKHESVLFLKNPKLLSDVTENFNNTLEVDIPNIINGPSSLKNEKKNKLNSKSSNSIENKKNKLKQKKKNRSKIYLDKDFSDTIESLKLSQVRPSPFIRPTKNLKDKKTNKNKDTEISHVESKTAVTKTVLPVNSPKNIYLDNLLTVQELARKLNIPSAEIIKWLFLQGISVTINQSLDLSISNLIAQHYSFTVLQKKSQYKSLKIDKGRPNNGSKRSPVVTFLGHVDHGKTTLLNTIMKNNKINKEVGDITQSIGSYEILLNNCQESKKLIFLDTPGHEAFVSMRKRCTEITDLVILVVSADDGLKPQTIEAINHIQEIDLPFIVAINKIDKVDANIDLVKQQLSALNINSTDSGGLVPMIPVSAIKGENIDFLLSTLLNLCETQNLQSDPSQTAEGMILEAFLDRQRGPVVKILVQNGTLFVGNIIVAGSNYGKVKAIIDNDGYKVTHTQSTALYEVLGFPSVSDIGLPFEVVKDEKIAKSKSSSHSTEKITLNLLNTRISLESLNKDGNKRVIKPVNIIIKTDVQGSIDPIIYAFSKIPQEKVQLNILSASSGETSSKDIQLALTSNAIIIAFNINVSSFIMNSAENTGVVIKQFNIIYDLVDYIQDYMLTFVEIEYDKEILGHAEVRNLFFINKGVVAGCFILDGKLKRNEYISIIRKNQVVYDGLLNSLKRVKDDVEEVLAGNECGLMCTNYNFWQEQDKIEAYTLRPLKKTL